MTRRSQHLTLHRETLAALTPGGPPLRVRTSLPTSSPSWLCIPCMDPSIEIVC
jgi:hypothetical protein